jgi:flagellar motor protein MotB
LRRRERALFPINVWPPLVDAVTLVLAAFVLLVVIAAVGQRGLIGRLRDKETELDRLREEKARVERRLRALAPAGSFEVDEGKVILQGEVLFDSGSDELRPAGRDFVGKMAPALKTLLDAEPDQMVLVGGHTDNVAIHGAALANRFASNWELSAARAVSVSRALIAAGLPATRITAAGFGDQHPRRPNLDEPSRRLNRRIEVLLVPIRAVSSR